MFEGIINFFKKKGKKEEKKESSNSRDTAKERLHLVLMQDRANVSADFLELMKQEIIEVIKKYIEIDEGAIDVRLTNKENEDGTNGAPALYANIPILNIKHEVGKAVKNTSHEKQNDANLKENKEIKNEPVKEDITKQDNTKQNSSKKGNSEKNNTKPKDSENQEIVESDNVKKEINQENTEKEVEEVKKQDAESKSIEKHENSDNTEKSKKKEVKSEK